MCRKAWGYISIFSYNADDIDLSYGSGLNKEWVGRVVEL